MRFKNVDKIPLSTTVFCVIISVTKIFMKTPNYKIFDRPAKFVKLALILGLAAIGIYFIAGKFEISEAFSRQNLQPSRGVIARFSDQEISDESGNANSTYNFLADFGDLKVELNEKAEDSAGYKFSDSDGNFLKIALKEPLTSMRAEKESGAVNFESQEMGVKYDLSQKGKIKADYILKKNPGKFFLDFKIEKSEGLTVVRNSPENTAAYGLINEDGREIFQILPSTVEDATGKKGFSRILIAGNSLKLIVSKDFLDSAVYPVTIDPTSIYTSALANATGYSTGRKIFRDSNGNLIVATINTANDLAILYKNVDSSWSSATVSTTATNVMFLSAGLDGLNGLHVIYQDGAVGTGAAVKYIKVTFTYSGSNITVVSASGTVVTLSDPGTNLSSQAPSLTILHNNAPAAVWAYVDNTNAKNNHIEFQQCINNPCDTTAKWGNGAGTASAVDSFGSNTAAKSIIMYPSIEQMPGTGTNAKAIWVFWSEKEYSALKYTSATCNCDIPPTWNAFAAVATPDASTGSAVRSTYVGTLADSANERVLVTSASSGSSYCSEASAFCQISWFITRNGATSTVKSISDNTTEANVDAQPSLAVYAGATPDYYLVFSKNSSGNITRKTIEAPASAATDWVSGTSWGITLTTDYGTGNTWPSAKINDAGSQWDIVYMSAANTLSYDSGTTGPSQLSWNTGAADFKIFPATSGVLTWNDTTDGAAVCAAALTDDNTSTVSCSSGSIANSTQYRVQVLLKNLGSPAVNMNGIYEAVGHINVKGGWAGTTTPVLGTCGFYDADSNDGSTTCSIAWSSAGNGNTVRITNTGAGNVVIGTTTGSEGFMYLITTGGDVPSTNSTSYMNMPAFCGENVTFTYKGAGVTYGTVSSQGECWMDRNLGASAVATAYNDSNGYGDIFQWGRLDDQHQTRTSGITTTLSTTDNPGHSNFIYNMASPFDWRSPQNNNLWQGVSGTNNPCPSGWRIPTKVELNTERASWSLQNYNGAFASPLKLTTGGYRHYSDALLYNVGTSGNYWSSTVSGNSASYLTFTSSVASIASNVRADGFSVRCVQD